MDRYQVG